MPWPMFKIHVAHLVTLRIETVWLAAPRMTHLIQNGCLSGVGVADDQDSEALGALFG